MAGKKAAYKSFWAATLLGRHELCGKYVSNLMAMLQWNEIIFIS